jgi:hypothetical protein
MGASDQAVVQKDQRVRIRTLLAYWTGNRQAILDIASNRSALWVGLLFVFSAVFARDYDGEDLLHEPWRLLIPLGASLAASFLLFSVAYSISIFKGASAWRFFSAYRSFLGLFWFTAPLAWLYAIPYERFLDAPNAVRANLWTLGLVAVWRVAIIVRTMSVTMYFHPAAALCLVMTFADVLVLWLTTYLPFPIFQLMAGVRLSAADEVRRGTAETLILGSVCTLPFWLVGTLLLAFRTTPYWRVDKLGVLNTRGVTKPLLALSCFSVLVWAIVLPFTQPEQQLRRSVEQAFAEGQTAEALAMMSAHDPSDFPPGWDPPPRVPSIKLLDVWEEMDKSKAAPWVREVYLQKLRGWLRNRFLWLDMADYAHIDAVVSEMPEGPAMMDELEHSRDHPMHWNPEFLPRLKALRHKK